MKFRLFFVTFVTYFATAVLCCGATQQRKTTLTGKVILDDGWSTAGALTVSIEGSRLRASATYPVYPKSDYHYISMVDAFDSDLDKDGFIEGKAVRKIRQAIIEVGTDGIEHPVAYVNFQEIGRFQGRYKDGTLEVEGRFFQHDRNPQYEIVNSSKARLVLDTFKKNFDARAESVTFFKWVFPKKDK